MVMVLDVLGVNRCRRTMHVLRRLIRFIHRDRKIGVANRLTVKVLDAERFINQK